MLKVINYQLVKLGQSFLDEISDVDWGDDEPVPYAGGRISPDNPPPGIINENNFEEYEPSVEDIENIEPEGQPQIQPEPYDVRQEIPTQNELLGIPPDTAEISYDGTDGNDIQQLLNDGMQLNEVISFEYTNRFGQYAGTRTVEPHYTFIASTTGNEILVTFDRDQNDIRAFIVGNIHPFGVRYKDVKFQPRGEIMRSIE